MIKNIFIAICIIILTTNFAYAQKWAKGIYLTQSTLENTGYLKYLIRQAKASGINTFVIDFKRTTPAYKRNIRLVKRNHIKYVARIVVFPNGGLHHDITSKEYWQEKYKLVQGALKFGAQEIQLDYIRYKIQQSPSPQNAKNIYRVIRWFKQKLQLKRIPLQIDVFGTTTFSSALTIGQDLALFADSIDAACPMVYPSHYEPYRKHGQIPYFTVLLSLKALRAQFGGNIPFKVYPFIELYNYRYPMSRKQKLTYIREQIRAVKDGNVNGWYAWNVHNKYDDLFAVLRSK